MTASYTITPSRNDHSAITVDTLAETVTIYTTDNPTGLNYATSPPTAGMTYTVQIHLVTEAGTTKSATAETLSFDIVISDPCIDDVISLISGTGVVPSTPVSYTAGDTALAITFDYSQTVALTVCPSVEYSVTLADESTTDSSVYTFTDAVTGTYTVHTTDRLKAGL